MSDLRRLLAHRDARIYLPGQILSVIGDNSLWLAMGIWIKILTGSNTDAGLALFPFTWGLLLAPAGGLLADHFRRARLLVVVNLIAAAGVSVLLLVRGPGQIWLIWIVMFCYGAASTVIVSAQTALLAVLLPGDLLPQANAVLQMASQGLRIITPLVGAGLLVWVGPSPLILLDASTFLIAAACAAGLRIRENRPAPGGSRWWPRVTAGFRYLSRDNTLARMLIAVAVALCAFGFSNAAIYAVTGQGLHKPAAFVAVLYSGMGIGALAGGIIAPAAIRRLTPAGLVATGLWAAVACFLLLTTPWPTLAVTGMALVGLAVVWLNVGVTTLIQQRTPANLTGRVDAALSMAATVPQAGSIGIGAALIAAVPYRAVLIIMTTMLSGAALYLRAPQVLGRLRSAPRGASGSGASGN